jgi:type II secretory pathway component PulC
LIAISIRLAQGLMGAACAAMIWGIVAPLRALSVPEVAFVEPAPPSAEVASFPRYAVIGSRNLFQTPTVAPLLAVQEVIEESKIRAKLVGTLAAVPESLSYAVIEDARAQRQILRAGDEIEPGVVIARVERRRVVFQNRGRAEALSMEDEAAPRSLALLRSGQQSRARVIVEKPEPVAYFAVAGRRSKPAPRPARDAQVAQASTRPRAAAEQPRRPLQNPATVEFLTAEQARRLIDQGFSTRPPVGFTALAGPVEMASTGDFSAVAGEQLLRSVIDRAALADGEQVLAVNGVPVDDERRLGELLAGLAQGGPARLKIAVNSTTEREIEVQLP